MDKPVLVATRTYPEAVEERIAQTFTERRNPHGRALTQEELLALADGADALLVSGADKLDARFFERLPASVKAIATFSVGLDHVDLAAARARGVPVANTPGVLDDAVADMTLLLLLAASRRANEGQELVRSGGWAEARHPDLLGTQMTGRVLGIYGMGRIGRAVAQRARAFGMAIHYNNRTELPPELAEGAVFHANPDDLLGVSAFLSLHAPSTPETQHFLNARTIPLLPRGAIVVNTARGVLIDDAALIPALRSCQVGAAGLDVFEGEPEVNPGYLELPNVFVMPHVGSATVETRTAMGNLALDNIDAVLAGRPPLTPAWS